MRGHAQAGEAHPTKNGGYGFVALNTSLWVCNPHLEKPEDLLPDCIPSKPRLKRALIVVLKGGFKLET